MKFSILAVAVFLSAVLALPAEQGVEIEKGMKIFTVRSTQAPEPILTCNVRACTEQNYKGECLDIELRMLDREVKCGMYMYWPDRIGRWIDRYLTLFFLLKCKAGTGTTYIHRCRSPRRPAYAIWSSTPLLSFSTGRISVKVRSYLF